jgi:hypothetical protein
MLATHAASSVHATVAHGGRPVAYGTDRMATGERAQAGGLRADRPWRDRSAPATARSAAALGVERAARDCRRVRSLSAGRFHAVSSIRERRAEGNVRRLAGWLRSPLLHARTDRPAPAVVEASNQSVNAADRLPQDGQRPRRATPPPAFRTTGMGSGSSRGAGVPRVPMVPQVPVVPEVRDPLEPREPPEPKAPSAPLEPPEPMEPMEPMD